MTVNEPQGTRGGEDLRHLAPALGKNDIRNPDGYTSKAALPIIPPLWRIMLKRESGENPELARSGKGERSDIRALPSGGKPSP